MKYIKKLKKHYDSIAIDIVDHEKKYIYFCLHFDPEANTLPKDNMYFNQLLNIRIVASSLPKDWVLYVKEHPHQLSYSLYKDIFLNQLHSIDNFRSKYFYSYISSLENVELISMKSDHRKLVQGAEFIVSNTGTIFREASYINKRCLTFSKKSIYALLDNIDEVRDLVSCQKAINNKADVIVNENVEQILTHAGYFCPNHNSGFCFIYICRGVPVVLPHDFSPFIPYFSNQVKSVSIITKTILINPGPSGG